MKPLDIVIPVYNEGETIHSVLDSFIESVQTPLRVLICYDDDHDNTLSALESYPKRDEIEIVLVKNHGRGAHEAVMSGMSRSEAPAILTWPADDDFNAGIIDGMVQLTDDGCDLVAASRFVKGGCMQGAPWLKSVLVRLASFTLYHIARLPVRDSTNGLRLFSRRVIERIPIESTVGFCYSIELLAKCHRLGWKIGEVPSVWYERTVGQSRFRVLKWLPGYLRWYFYIFNTTFLRAKSVTLRPTDHVRA